MISYFSSNFTTAGLWHLRWLIVRCLRISALKTPNSFRVLVYFGFFNAFAKNCFCQIRIHLDKMIPNVHADILIGELHLMIMPHFVKCHKLKKNSTESPRCFMQGNVIGYHTYIPDIFGYFLDYNDKLWWQQRRQNWHHDNSRLGFQ